MNLNRISIIGAPGTGKTTLANELSKIYNISATHIDGIHHLENWQVRDKKERDEIILDIVEKERWIIDGTYHATLRTRVEKADSVIWLDYSSLAQLKGVVRRWIKSREKEKPEIPGCKEQLTFKFLKYVSKYNKEKRQIIVNNLEGIDKSKLLIFKKQRDLNKWLKEQKESSSNGKTNSRIF